MKINSGAYKALPFYLLVIGIFLVIISPSLLSEGMFMDGLIYSTIAKNLANGIGTFWNPHFTSTCLTNFHEHPPLAIGIQSIFISIFGESRYIDKIYSLLTFIIVGFVILKIWKTLGYTKGWFPLLLWLSIPLVSWACTNDLLENTMTIFTSFSILFYLKSQNNKKYFFIFLSGLMLSFGFLTKGFVAFFPWTFPFLIWLLLRKKSFGSMFIETSILFLCTAIPLLLLILISPVAKLSLHNYIDTQVINSLKHATTVSSRFFIVKRLFSELIPVISLCVIFIIVGLRKKISISLLKDNYKMALVFFLFSLTGVLPIMISMKQSGFYILSTFPFFAIAFAILLNPLIEILFNKINYQSIGFLIFKWIGFGVFFVGIILSLYFSNHFERDENKIKDTYLILSKLPEGSTINVYLNLWSDWSLHGYYARYKNISLDPELSNKRMYLLVQNESYSDTINKNYQIVNLPTKEYKLFKKK